MMGGQGGSRCPAPEVLESIAAGTCADDAAGRHVESCGACRASLMEIKENRRFLEDFLPTGAGGKGSSAREAVKDVGDAVAGYEIVGELGRGGQASVYKAIQLATHRKVALKMSTKAVISDVRERHRFENEITLVAAMRHPFVVTVYDSGVTRDGRFYIAMEYIRGTRLDEWTRKIGEQSATRGLDPVRRAKVELLAKVCDAVQYAHTRGIIHRDLKPSNIIVDAENNPRLLDFGVARTTVATGEHLTMTGQFAGTPAYASPEQVAGSPDQIDTRTDIYSLGVVLFEMMVGGLPYPVEGSLQDMIRSITTSEPQIPVKRDTATGAEPLNSDLETILRKSMSKDRDRRYLTAAEFGDDLRRYLNNEPLLAKRDSTLYVYRKWAWKHRAAVAAGVLILVALAGAAVVSTVSLAGEKEAKRKLEKLVGAFKEVVSRSGTETGAISDAEVQAMIARAADAFGGEEAGLAGLLFTQGRLFEIAGEHAHAEIVLREAVARAEKAAPSREMTVLALQARETLGENLFRQVKAEEAAEQLRMVIEKCRAGNDVAITRVRATALGSLIDVLNTSRAKDSAMIEEVGRLWPERITVLESVYGKADPRAIMPRIQYGTWLVQRLRLTEAKPVLLEGYQQGKDVLGLGHASTDLAWNGLMQVYVQQSDRAAVAALASDVANGYTLLTTTPVTHAVRQLCDFVGFLRQVNEFEGARGYADKAYERLKELPANDRLRLDVLMANATIYNAIKNEEKTAAMFTELTEAVAGYTGKKDSEYVRVMYTRGNWLATTPRTEEAEDVLSRAVEVGSKFLPVGDELLTMVRNRLITFYQVNARRAGSVAAGTLYEDAARGIRERGGDADPRLAVSMVDGAEWMRERGRGSDGTARALEAMGLLEKAAQPSALDLARARVCLGLMYLAQGQGEQAAGQLRPVAATTVGGDAKMKRLVGMAKLGLAEVLLASDAEGALTAAKEAEALLRPPGGGKDREHGEASITIGLALGAQGKFAEGEALVKQGYEEIDLDKGACVERLARAAERVAMFYDGWHAGQPGGGRDELARQWRGKAQESTEAASAGKTKPGAK